MPKVVWIDETPHRVRRGILVPIPREWFGKTVSQQQINRRESNSKTKQQTGKQLRAQTKAAMVHDEEPNPNAHKKLKTSWDTSGRTDSYRNKYRKKSSGM